ncbi:MAG TPA: BlaI/MecI/CopY family transcriptional regulator [Longimicrobium sp.]|nr:BlaI/MecI/CopY family transcriptional regulator [Longimicrobium sp.]
MSTPAPALSRRESQIMDVIHRLGECTAYEIRDNLPDPPGYGAVRRLLTIMEEKGFVAKRQDGPRYVYRGAVPREAARESALRHLLGTFFGGSVEHAVRALLDLKGARLDPEELERVSRMIDDARQEGR